MARMATNHVARSERHGAAEDELIARHIWVDPEGEGWAEARLADGGVAVWAIVAAADSAGGHEGAAVERYELSDEQLRAAMAYYRRHKALVDAVVLLSSPEAHSPAVVIRAEEALIRRHIEEHPDNEGFDEARLVDSGVSVWAVVGHLPAVNGDVARVADDYGLSMEEVGAVMAFYRRYKAIIDNRIASNSVD